MTNKTTPQELEDEFKSTVLRPLADMFQKLTREIDSGEYELPTTIYEAAQITESYIEQAWERSSTLIQQQLTKARIDELKLEQRQNYEAKRSRRISELEDQLNKDKEEV